jgi:hypothetical protein
MPKVLGCGGCGRRLHKGAHGQLMWKRLHGWLVQRPQPGSGNFPRVASMGLMGVEVAGRGSRIPPRSAVGYGGVVGGSTELICAIKVVWP